MLKLNLPWLRAAADSHVGRVRERNEDGSLLAAWAGAPAVLAVVVDGLGGHGGGDVAAALAVETFAELTRQPLPEERQARYDLLFDAFVRADRRLREEASTSFALLGMGATAVAAILTPGEFLYLYAGDARLYHYQQHGQPYVTADHSIVRVLIDLGQITPEQAKRHPLRSRVTSCLGGGEDAALTIEPAWLAGQEDQPAFRPLYAGDTVLLCSDGLHGMVEQPEIDALVAKNAASPPQMVEQALQAALAAGGHDNITLIALHVAADGIRSDFSS